MLAAATTSGSSVDNHLTILPVGTCLSTRRLPFIVPDLTGVCIISPANRSLAVVL